MYEFRKKSVLSSIFLLFSIYHWDKRKHPTTLFVSHHVFFAMYMRLNFWKLRTIIHCVAFMRQSVDI